MFTHGRFTELVYEPLRKQVDANMIVHEGHWRGTYAPAGGEPGSLKGNYVHVYRRHTDGSWKLATDMANIEPPPAR